MLAVDAEDNNDGIGYGNLDADGCVQYATPSVGGSLGSTAIPTAKLEKPWRPWHGQTHLAWAQVRETSEVDVGAQDERRCTAGSPVLSKAERATPTRKAACETSRHLGIRIDRNSIMQRPAWNPRLAGGNPNWMNNRGNVRKPLPMRTMFSRPQSLPELHRYYRTHAGFDINLRRLDSSEPSFRKSFLSTDPLDVTKGPDLIPSRSFYANTVGRMRDSYTGAPTPWRDHFQEPPQLKDLCVASATSLQCPGAPPKHLYMDEYEEEF